MSDDAKAAKELVETLKDGEKGFADAADKVRDGDYAAWATTLQRLSEQRAGFWREIVDMGHEYGDDVDNSGTVAAAVHPPASRCGRAKRGPSASISMYRSGMTAHLEGRPCKPYRKSYETAHHPPRSWNTARKIGRAHV